MCGVLLMCSLVVMASTLEAFIDCETSCFKCQMNDEQPEVLDVYCSMCDECRAKTMDVPNRLSEEDTPAGDLEQYQNEVPDEPYEDYIQPDTTDGYMEWQPELITPRRNFMVQGRTRMRSRPKFFPRITRYRPNRPKGQPIAASDGGVGKSMQDVLAGWPQGCPTPPVCDTEYEDEEKPPTKPLPSTSTSITTTTTSTTTTATTTTTTTPRPCPEVTQCFKKRKIRRPPPKRPRLQQQPCMMPCKPAMTPCCNENSILQLNRNQINKLLFRAGKDYDNNKPPDPVTCNMNSVNANQVTAGTNTVTEKPPTSEEPTTATTTTEKPTTATEKPTTTTGIHTTTTEKYNINESRTSAVTAKEEEFPAVKVEDVDDDDQDGGNDKNVLRYKKRGPSRPGNKNLLKGKLMKKKGRRRQEDNDHDEDDEDDKDFYYLYVGVPPGLLQSVKNSSQTRRH